MPYFSDSVVFSTLSEKKKKVLKSPGGLPIFNAMDVALLFTEASVHWLYVVNDLL